MNPPPYYRPRRIPSTVLEEEGNFAAIVCCSSNNCKSDDLATKPSEQRLSQHTYLTRRSTAMSGGSGESSSSCIVGAGPISYAQHHHRPSALVDFTVTASTKASSINNSPIMGEEETRVHVSSSSKCNNKSNSSPRRNNKLRIGYLTIPKLPIKLGYNNRQHQRKLSEAQLRKRVKKAAERGHWDAVRKLISNYEFSEIPEVLAKKQAQRASLKQAAQRRNSNSSFVAPPNPDSELNSGNGDEKASRRPSYGSNNGGMRRSFTNNGGMRRSFTGNQESAAAAAAIMASLLEESLESLECEQAADNINGGAGGHQHCPHICAPDYGENILHDVCRFSPPLDVTELLLKALRHRRGVTSGTDDMGRTPLHLAAHCGAMPEVIDAIVRADPSPATTGDVDRRSPLHLAMRNLSHSNNNDNNENSNHHKSLDRMCQTVLILKDAMLTYPGRIDFKDEDNTGFSPLDYGLDGNISKEELLQSLIRRKEPTTKGSRLSGSCSKTQRRSGGRRRRTSLRRRTSDTIIRRFTISSFTSCESQDIDVLEQLEQDEINERKRRISKLKSRKVKEVFSDALFDVFGIDQQQQPASAVADVASPAPKEEVQVQQPQQPQHQVDEAIVEKEVVELTVDQAQAADQEEQKDLGMTDEAIYDQHLQDYLDEYMDDFAEGDLEYADEDGFDILEDPSAANCNEQQEDADAAALIDDSTLRGVMSEPPAEIIIVSDNYDDDDCESVVSEVTVSLSR